MPRSSSTPGVAISSGASSRSGKLGAPGCPARDLEVGRVVAALAAHERVLARARRRQEVLRFAASHHPGLGLHLVDLEPAALEDAVVGTTLELEAAVEPLIVDVERVGVLHHELADAEEAAARARLVPLLRLEVVEHLRQLPVRLQLARMERERLLVRQREHELAPAPVGQPEELRDLVAAGCLPELGRCEHRRRHLLAADRVHLLADDLDDVLVRLPAERQVRPETGAHLADVAAADEQLVRVGLGVGRRVAQGRQEEL